MTRRPERRQTGGRASGERLPCRNLLADSWEDSILHSTKNPPGFSVAYQLSFGLWPGGRAAEGGCSKLLNFQVSTPVQHRRTCTGVYRIVGRYCNCISICPLANNHQPNMHKANIQTPGRDRAGQKEQERPHVEMTHARAY